jgi:hypothetical protein
VLAGIIAPLQGVAAAAGGVVLWSLYFAIGFRAFTRGMEANRLGLLLTVGLPLVVFVLTRTGWRLPAACLPPGAVYYAALPGESTTWLLGVTISGALALITARRALASCDRELRLWYEGHHGRAILD